MTETARLAQLLAPRLQALWGASAEITGIGRLPGGASRESWGVQARLAGGDHLPVAHLRVEERRLILLCDPVRSDRHRDVAVEAAAMVAARAAGVPVPELYDHGTEALGPGRAYLLMERLDGETIPRRLLRDDAYAAVRPGLGRRAQRGDRAVRGLRRAAACARDRTAVAGRAPAPSRGGRSGARRFPDRQPHCGQ